MMSEKLRLRTQNVKSTEQLIVDIQSLIVTIELLRIRIALHLLSLEVPPQRGGTSSK